MTDSAGKDRKRTGAAAADEAALRWAIALEEARGEPDETEAQARFAAWLAAEPAHRRAWEEVQTVWHLLGETAPAPQAPSNNRRRAVPRARLAVAAAAAALAACLLVFLLPTATLYLEADAKTAVGETRQIALADGSRLFLGADSAVAIDYSATARRIRLLAGTAFVEVVPDPARRFTVAAGSLESSALGTAYEVRRLDRSTWVAVAHGSVAAEDAAAGLDERLEAGDWLQVGQDGTTPRGTAGPADVAAWRDGRLAVKDWSLAEVAEALRDHFHGAILVLDDAAADSRVTGIYDLGDPAAALRAAAYPSGARVHAVTPWLLVVSAG